MKKIFSLLALFLAFSFSMNAQEKQEINPQVQAKADAVKVSELLKLDDMYREGVYRLFEMKYMTLADKTLPAERKKELSKIIEAKLRATFSGEQMAILESKKEFFDHLIN